MNYFRGKKFACMIGRFNPLHLGHEFVIQTMISEFGIKNCLIIVGSAQESRTEKNLFSYKERKGLIEYIFLGLLVKGLDDYAYDKD